MIRPFYRSRLFWLGLPGLVGLIWGWSADYSGVRWSNGEIQWDVGNRFGVIEISISEDHLIKRGSGGHFSFRPGLFFWEDATGSKAWIHFPPAFEQEKIDLPGLSRSTAFIAYWL